MKPNELREFLADNLIGQDHVIDELLPPLTRYNAGFHFSNRPAGVFLLMGPSGSGKTETVELMAKALHGSRSNMLHINCGEYAFDHEIAKLIGAPPGYLGHKETRAVLSQQNLAATKSQNHDLMVILFDEIEKASPAMHKLLLGVLDKGHLKTGDAQQTVFTRTLIFFTSNLGLRETSRTSYTFEKKELSERAEAGISEAAARAHFPTEFLNRLDKIITYHHLTQDHLRRIVRNYALDSNINFEKVDGTGRLKISVSDAASNWLIEQGYSREFGARELRRVWESKVVLPLAEFVGACAGTSRQWDTLRVDLAGGRLEFIPMTLEETLRESIHLIAPGRREDGIFKSRRARG